MKTRFLQKAFTAAVSATAAFALAACGSDPVTPDTAPPAEGREGDDPATETSARLLPEGDVVAAAFEGHLEQVNSEGVQPFSLAGSKPEFYLLYYTASW